VNPDVPYKTLLLSLSDSAAHVVAETLDKYGMGKENPDSFCLVEVCLVMAAICVRIQEVCYKTGCHVMKSIKRIRHLFTVWKTLDFVMLESQ